MRIGFLLSVPAIAATLVFAGCSEDSPSIIPTVDLVDAGQATCSFTPVSIHQGEPFDVQVEIRNLGNKSSGSFTVEFYSSSNTIISWLDHLLGSVLMGSIEAGGQATCALNVVNTSTIPVGNWYIGWDIDSGYAVNESDEDNNTNVKTGVLLQVLAPPNPDLRDRGETYRSFTPQTASQGAPLAVSCDIENAGTAGSGAFAVRFYASANTSIQTSDYLIGSAAMAAIPLGSYAACSLPAGDLSAVPPGTYYVGWIIDADAQVTELVETNNTAYKTGYQLVITQTATGWIGGASDGWKTSSAPPSASDLRSFNRPAGLCLDSAGNIYAADSENHRICKWSSAGAAIGWIGGGNTGWQTAGTSASGAGDHWFARPYGVFVTTGGDIYVADRDNHRISKWDGTGQLVGWIGGGLNGWQTGSAPVAGTDFKSFQSPRGIFVSSAGDLFVADTGNNRIAKWDGSGTAAGWIGGAADAWQTTAAPASGSDYRSFSQPSGVWADSSGNIFVADTGNCRVSKWSGTGTAAGWIGGAQNGWQTGTAPASGTDYQSFVSPAGIYVDATGRIVVADSGAGCVFMWSGLGNAYGWIGGGVDGWQTGTTASASGADYRRFQGPTGVFGNASGNLFVADCLNDRVSKW